MRTFASQILTHDELVYFLVEIDPEARMENNKTFSLKAIIGRMQSLRQKVQ